MSTRYKEIISEALGRYREIRHCWPQMHVSALQRIAEEGFGLPEMRRAKFLQHLHEALDNKPGYTFDDRNADIFYGPPLREVRSLEA